MDGTVRDRKGSEASDLLLVLPWMEDEETQEREFIALDRLPGEGEDRAQEFRGGRVHLSSSLHACCENLVRRSLFIEDCHLLFRLKNLSIAEVKVKRTFDDHFLA